MSSVATSSVDGRAQGEQGARALQHKAAQGEYIGGDVPFGFRLSDDGVRLEPREDEQSVLRDARALRAQGLSLRAIAGQRERRAIRNRTGKPFLAGQVRRMLAA